MVPLVVHIVKEFPVVIHLGLVGLPKRGHIGKPITLNSSINGGQLSRYRTSPRLKSSKDQAVPDLKFERCQAVSCLIQTGKALRSGDTFKPSIQAIGPAMERTAQYVTTIALRLRYYP